MPKLTVPMPADLPLASRPALVLPEVVADGDQVFRHTPFEFDQTKVVSHGLIPASQPMALLRAEKVSKTILVRGLISGR